MIQIGDTIRFLDSVGGGKVTRINKARKVVYVEDEDGFEIPTAESQCVVIQQHEVKTLNAVHGPSLHTLEVKQAADNGSTSAIPARQLRGNGKKEAKKEDILEVDLHIEKLVRVWHEMQPIEILNYQLTIFRKTMRDNLRYRGRKIVFIHGRGKGVLKNAICQALDHDFPQCTYHDASFAQYEFGALMVIIP